MLVGKCPFDQSLQILKLPPAPAGVSARSGRAFRRFPGLPASIIEKRYKKHRLMVIEHCLSVSIAQSFAASRLAPSAAPRGPSRRCLCCCYDSAALAAPIWSRNATGRAALPLFPHCFLCLFRCFRACQPLSALHSKRTDSRCTYIDRLSPY